MLPIANWALSRLPRLSFRSFSEKDKTSLREELKSSAEGFLKDMVRVVTQEGGIAAEVHIQEGVPHEVILEEASHWSADLIVMGKLGRRGVSHILLGSVTERVVEFSEVPVLVVK